MYLILRLNKYRNVSKSLCNKYMVGVFIYLFGSGYTFGIQALLIVTCLYLSYTKIVFFFTSSKYVSPVVGQREE